MIDPKVIEEIKARNPIEEIMMQYVTLKRAGSNMICSCPFHSERTPSCTVFLSEQSFYCFGCGVGGDVISFIRKIENLGYVEALEYLAKRAGINLVLDTKNNQNTPKVDKSRFFDMNRQAAVFFRDMLNDQRVGADARTYVETRQLTSLTVKRFGLGYAPNSFDMLKKHMNSLGYTDKELIDGYLCVKTQKGHTIDFFRDRLMFPVFDTTGNIIAFGGRMIHPAREGEEGRKYMNTSDTPVYSKRKNLFALNFAKNKCADNLILCEGNIDVVMLHQAGFENAVATLGTAITPEQARLMGRYTKKVIITYDSDAAGQNATNKAIKVLSEAGIDATVLKMSGAKDPDEYIKIYGASAFAQLLDESVSPFRFKVNSVLSKYNINNIDQKIKALSDIADILADIPQRTERELYMRQISDELDVKLENIESDVKRTIKKRQKKTREEDSRNIIRQTAGYSDKVNPDFAKNVQAAKAEEHILALLMLYDEHRKKTVSESILSPDDFITDFGRRAFEKIIELEVEGQYSESVLGEFFTVDEMSRLKKIQLDRSALSNNSNAVFIDCVNSLKKEKDNLSVQSEAEDIQSIISRKKQSLKK